MNYRKLRILLAICFLAQLFGLFLYGYQLLILIFATTVQINWLFYEFTEIVAFLALLIGSIVSLFALLRLQERTQRLESKLDAASSRFHDVIIDQFHAWSFSEAECEIGMLMIKGMSIAEIADLRGRSQATVKAQNSAIYQKSGLANRAQLVSYFVEELTSGF